MDYLQYAFNRATLRSDHAPERGFGGATKESLQR